MTRVEERLRSAFAEAAETVSPDLRPLSVAAQSRPRSGRWILPLVAAASVAALVVGTAGLLDSGPRRTHLADPAHRGATHAPPPATSTPVRAAERGVVKITATAPGCRRRLEGTGFVYAPDRVMTAAHVVAGSRGPVEVSAPADRSRHQATVVVYDPRRDVAVLAVPGLRVRALKLSPAAALGAPAVIAGYPQHSAALTTTAATILARHSAYGPDIYQASRVLRKIFLVHTTAGAVPSGSPLLATDGSVYGLVFATSLDDARSAYALTAEEISHDAQASRTTGEPVSTQGCAG